MSLMLEQLLGGWVIARRDFIASVRSKAFLLFLVGPLLPFAFGNLFDTGIGAEGLLPTSKVEVSSDIGSVHAWNAARDRLAKLVGVENVPQLLPRTSQSSDVPLLTGDVWHPVLAVPKGSEASFRSALGPILYDAYLSTRQPGPVVPPPNIRYHPIAGMTVSADRTLAAHAAQLGLFILTMLLSGILLSNLVEEKTTKTLDILAAAVAIDTIFFGKLLAVLGVALCGVFVWGTALALYVNLIGTAFSIPTPAVGWSAFTALGFAYSASIILLFGAIYLGVGAQANTSRDVQAIAMPLTIVQVLVFALASSAITQANSPIGILAAVFPWSSPFAMLGRSYFDPGLWPHAAALLWQVVATAMTVVLGAALFRINVMKQAGITWFTRGQRSINHP